MTPYFPDTRLKLAYVITRISICCVARWSKDIKSMKILVRGCVSDAMHGSYMYMQGAHTDNVMFAIINMANSNVKRVLESKWGTGGRGELFLAKAHSQYDVFMRQVQQDRIHF